MKVTKYDKSNAQYVLGVREHGSRLCVELNGEDLERLEEASPHVPFHCNSTLNQYEDKFVCIAYNEYNERMEEWVEKYSYAFSKGEVDTLVELGWLPLA